MDILLGSFFIAIVLTALVAFGFGKERDLVSLIKFFTLIFFPVWALALWIPGTGPVWYGVAWVDFIFFAIMMVLFITAISPTKNNEDVGAISNTNGMVVKTNTIAFWAFLVFVAVAILLGFNRTS